MNTRSKFFVLLQWGLLGLASLPLWARDERNTNQLQPMWSPDGQYYACIEWREQTVTVVIYERSNTKKAVQTLASGDVGKTQVEDLMGGVGGGARQEVINFFDWAHDSQHYVFLRSGTNGYDLFVGKVGMDPKNAWALTADQETELMPRWSPDDRYIVYVRAGDLYALKMDQKTKKPIKDANGKIIGGQLTNDPDVPDLYPEWKPAQYKSERQPDYELVFSRLKEGTPPFSYNIAVYKAGGNDLQFAPGPNDETRLKYVTLDNTAHELHPVYSPDGRRLAFYVIAKGELNYYLYTIDLYIHTSPVTDLKAKYSSIKKLSALSVLPSMFMGPSWSFDSRNVAFIENKLPYYPIHVVDIENLKEMKSDTLDQFANLGKGYFQNSDVAWSPKNSESPEKSYNLAFISRNAKSSLKDLLVKDAAESAPPRKITFKIDAMKEDGETVLQSQMPDSLQIKIVLPNRLTGEEFWLKKVGLSYEFVLSSVIEEIGLRKINPYRFSQEFQVTVLAEERFTQIQKPQTVSFEELKNTQEYKTSIRLKEKPERTVRIVALDPDDKAVTGMSVWLASEKDEALKEFPSAQTDLNGVATMEKVRIESGVSFHVGFSLPFQKNDVLDDPVDTKNLTFSKGVPIKTDTLLFRYKAHTITLDVKLGGHPSLEFEAFWFKDEKGRNIPISKTDFEKIGNDKYRFKNIRGKPDSRIRVYFQRLREFALIRGEDEVLLLPSITEKPMSVTFPDVISYEVLSVRNAKTSQPILNSRLKITRYQNQKLANNTLDHSIEEIALKNGQPYKFETGLDYFVAIACDDNNRDDNYIPSKTLILRGGDLVSKDFLPLLSRDNADYISKDNYKQGENKLEFSHELKAFGENAGAKITIYLLPIGRLEYFITDAKLTLLSDIEFESNVPAWPKFLKDGQGFFTWPDKKRTTLDLTFRKKGHGEKHVQPQPEFGGGDCKVLNVILDTTKTDVKLSDCQNLTLTEKDIKSHVTSRNTAANPMPPAKPSETRQPNQGNNPDATKIKPPIKEPIAPQADSIVIEVRGTINEIINDVNVELELNDKSLPRAKVDQSGRAIFVIPEDIPKESLRKVLVKIIKNGKERQISSPGEWPIPFDRLIRRSPRFYFLPVVVFKE